MALPTLVKEIFVVVIRLGCMVCCARKQRSSGHEKSYMLKVIFEFLIFMAFVAGGVIFFGLNLYSNLILLPRMKEKGIIDRHEHAWYSLTIMQTAALRDYLETHQDEEFSLIYARLHQLSKLVVWLIGGSLTTLTIKNLIESS